MIFPEIFPVNLCLELKLMSVELVGLLFFNFEFNFGNLIDILVYFFVSIL